MFSSYSGFFPFLFPVRCGDLITGIKEFANKFLAYLICYARSSWFYPMESMAPWSWRSEGLTLIRVLVEIDNRKIEVISTERWCFHVRDGRIKVIGGDGIEGLLMSPNQSPYKYLEVKIVQFLKVSYKLITSFPFSCNATDSAFILTVSTEWRLFSQHLQWQWNSGIESSLTK